jgi:hypothetical protein
VSAYITAKIGKPDQVKDFVVQYRANEKALRQIARHGGSNAATDLAVKRREDARWEAEASALAFGSDALKELLGALVEERTLLSRISDSTVARPDLRSRLSLNRLGIQRLIREVACGR